MKRGVSSLNPCAASYIPLSKRNANDRTFETAKDSRSGNESSRIVSNKMSTTPSPIYREFISVEGSDINSRSRSDGIRFRLVSYNILAQVYVKSSLFPHSPSPCLRWKARSQAILSVLKNFGADFLCLQEVDEYDSFYKGNMESLGYSSIYVQRNGQKRDGCGIFYKQKRFRIEKGPRGSWRS
ncbi:hypothetical protein CMV_022588 [Castanea mollissima]|uniref:Endonuclease/exonuclease/phosphatase domain-containing protein n=2 Tax=Castanea mollissima TaxID=60419 RepID=A0A8J4QHQ8_9ROSI|nr:hypothetical protein CMV_022588 [Castanea mollissima]